ncbi:hypothetical protein DET54_11415 [Paenibacillus pabuli]|uniref:Butirosin biosynthesis protein H-like n=1 Tax=Paenibacillus pabuli TaxID=1472 RepID=A0ABX9BES9_9BACL|nr:hypothetical protein [Paenibacillus pabuli]RAI89547.1 hypothetical protein DET54_11415 [Paenibacillus pabuli]
MLAPPKAKLIAKFVIWGNYPSSITLGGVCLTKILKKFEQNYLNCLTSKVISCFKISNVPFELFMYRAYENPKDIFDQFLLFNKKRWQCKNNILIPEDLKLLDIELIHKDEVEFDSLKKIIRQESQVSNMVFVAFDTFYLVHKNEEYLKKHQSHWVIVSYNKTSNLYYVLDDSSNGKGDFREHVYDEKSLKIAFENNSIKSYRYYSIKTDINKLDVYTTIFLNKACDYYLKSEISLAYYDLIPISIMENWGNSDKLNTLLDQIIEGLAYLAGSRYLSQLFFKFIDQIYEVQDLLETINEELNIIKLILLKSKVTNKINISDLQERFNNVKENESLLLTYIKLYSKKNISGH